MQEQCGPTFELGPLRPEERDVLFATLQDPQNFEAIGMRQPPSRDAIESQQLAVHEWQGASIQAVEYLVARARTTSAPALFWLHFGWSHVGDRIREADSISAPGYRHTPRQLVESYALMIAYLFRHDRAQRIRWRTPRRKSGPVQAFLRLGARCLGTLPPEIQQPGAASEHLYEITPREARLALGHSEKQFKTSALSEHDLNHLLYRHRR